MLTRRCIYNNILKKYYSGCCSLNVKVAIIGANGGIGKPLSLLLKTTPGIGSLALYDISEAITGVGVDLSHVNTATKVAARAGSSKLDEVIYGSHIVVIPAGRPRQPGMSRDDLFNLNASIVYDVSASIAKYSPNALIAIITNPVNSMVPIAFETLRCFGVCAADRIFGVTTLDVVRAATFIGEITGCDPENVIIPVIGGHSGKTIIPVFSQSCPRLNCTDCASIKKLTERVQEAGTEVIKAKAGGGSATLSMAFAAARMVKKFLQAMRGEQSIACAYVKSCITQSPYFSNPLLLGPNGIAQNLGTGYLNMFEQELVRCAIPELLMNIRKGHEYVIQRRAEDKKYN